MKFLFISVGKAHEPYVKEGVEAFTRRIGHYYPVEWKLIPVPKHLSTDDGSDLKKKESALILAAIQREDYLVLLEETGTAITSEGLASFIEARAGEGRKQVVFLIGGAYGVSNEVLERADLKWSLSKLVFPHQLVRLILAEQVYRACSIIRNEKYHHS